MDSNNFGRRYSSSARDTPRVYYNQQETARRNPTLLLWLGIIFAPFIFGWTLFGKGYSVRSRWLGFGWMALLAVTIINVVAHPDQVQPDGSATQQAQNNKPPVSQQADTSQDSTPTYNEADAQHDREQYCWNHPHSFGHSFMCSDVPEQPNTVIVVVPNSDDDN